MNLLTAQAFIQIRPQTLVHMKKRKNIVVTRVCNPPPQRRGFSLFGPGNILNIEEYRYLTRLSTTHIDHAVMCAREEGITSKGAAYLVSMRAAVHRHDAQKRRERRLRRQRMMARRRR